jgi:hypothetical protein
MYTFKLIKNGKEVISPLTTSTVYKTVAYEVWGKMQAFCEHRWGLFGYTYSLTMFKDGQELHHIDYEC